MKSRIMNRISPVVVRKFPQIRLIFSSAITLLLFSVAYPYITPSSFVYPLRILLGLIALVGIPGYCLSLALYDRPSGLTERLGISLIFGLALQVFNIVVLWAILDMLPIGLEESLCIMTFSAIVTLALFSRRKPAHEFIINRMSSTDVILLITFILAISLRLWYQSFSNSITPDGAYYCDIARNLVNSQVFTTKVIFAGDQIRLAYEQCGLTAYPYVPFFISLFFLIGDVSYFWAKLALVFAGSLMIFPTYGMSKELFNKRVGIIASIILAFNPLLTFYSSILFGEEIISNLLFLLAIYFLVLSFKYVDNFKNPILVGFFLFLSRGAWSYNADIFLVALPLLVILLRGKADLKFSLFSVSCAGLVFLHVFLGPKPIYWIPTTIAILIIGLIGLKNKDSHVKVLCLVLLSYTLLLSLLGVIRLYMHTEALSVTGVSLGEAASILVKPFSYDLANRADKWIDITKDLTQPLLTLSIASILILPRLKNTLLLFIHPLFYSSAFIFYYFIPYPYEERFFIPLILFFSILSASTIEALSSAPYNLTSIRLKIGKNALSKILRLNKLASFMLIFVVLSSIFYSYYYDEYFEGLDKMREINSVGDLHMEPTVQWIVENTPQNAILMNSNPTFYSWLADRHCVIARSLNITQLYKAINDFQVDYFVVDPETKSFLPEIYGFIARDWNKPLPGFFPVFYQQSSSDIPEVIVYGVAKARGLSIKEKHTIINNCDTAEKWYAETFYHSDNPTLEVDHIDSVEGEGSVVARSTNVPRDSDIYLAYRSSEPLNVSDAYHLHLWIKTNGLSQNANVWQVEINILDLNNHGDSWQFRWWVDGEWQELHLPIGSYTNYTPSGPPNLNQVIKITVRISNRVEAKPLTLWVDGLELIAYV